MSLFHTFTGLSAGREPKSAWLPMIWGPGQGRPFPTNRTRCWETELCCHAAASLYYITSITVLRAPPIRNRSFVAPSDIARPQNENSEIYFTGDTHQPVKGLFIELKNELVQRSGRRQAALVGIPRGDARNPIEWEDVLAKAAGYRTALTWIRKARPQDPIPQLLDALP